MAETTDRKLTEIYEIKIRCFDPNTEFSRIFEDTEYHKAFKGQFKLPKATRDQMRSVIQAMRNRVYHGCRAHKHNPLANIFDSHFAKTEQLGFILADCERTEEKLQEILKEAQEEYGIEVIPIEPSMAYVRAKMQIIPPLDPKDEAYTAIKSAIQNQIFDYIFTSKSFEKLKEALKSKKELPKRPLKAILTLIESLETLNLYNDSSIHKELSKLKQQIVDKQIPKVAKYLEKQLKAWEKGGQARQIRKYTRYNGVKIPDLPAIETRNDRVIKKAQAETVETPLASPPKRKVKRRRKNK